MPTPEQGDQRVASSDWEHTAADPVQLIDKVGTYVTSSMPIARMLATHGNPCGERQREDTSMSSNSARGKTESAASSVEQLGAYSRQHRAKHWAGTLEEFLRDILPQSPRAITRRSHEYLWDMLCWHGRQNNGEVDPSALFHRELFGIDAPLTRVVDYFKGAAAGSDVGRRLLLLLGPPSGGKSTKAILIKSSVQGYSHTDEGAVYALAGSPLHESPLNIIPTTLRAGFRDT